MVISQLRMASPDWFFPGRLVHLSKEGMSSQRSNSLLITQILGSHVQLNMLFMIMMPCVAVSSVLPAAAKAVDGSDDTEDASSAKGSALKRPVSSMMKTPSLSSNSKGKSVEGMPKGWTHELVGPIVIWSSPNGKKFRSWA